MLDLRNAANETISREICTGLRESFLSYQVLEDVCVFEGTDYSSIVSGIPFVAANLITVSCPKSKTDETLKIALEPVLERALPFLVWVLPPLRSIDCDFELKQAGLVAAENLPAMVASVHQPDEVPLPQNVSISLVKNSGEMNQWIEVFNKVYAWPAPALNLFQRIFENRLLHRKWEFYLARKSGRAIGCTSNFFGSKIAGLYSQGVIPEVRRKGVGRALVYYALQRARERNYLAMMLLASPEGFQLYKSCGFRECFQVTVFSRE